jgi:hypothetical protein
MAHRNEFSDEDDLDATVRGLHKLADSPGDLKFRQSIAYSFEKLTAQLNGIKVELAGIKAKMLDRVEVAKIAKAETDTRMAVLESKFETLNRIVWGLVGSVATALVVLAVTRIFGGK